MENKTVLALALSLFILIGFQVIMAKLYPPKPAGQLGETQNIVKIEPKTEPKLEIPDETKPVLPEEEEINFQNDLYDIKFTDVGAGIKKVTLKENPNCGLNISYDIFNAKDPADSFLIFFPDKFGSELNSVKYDVRRSSNEVVFTHNFNDGLVVEKRFRFHKSLYRIDLEISFKSIKDADVTKKYALILGSHPSYSHIEQDKFLALSADLDGKIFKNKKQARQFEIQRNGAVNWVMFKNKYFSIILKPSVPSSGYFVRQDAKGNITNGMSVNEINLPSGSTVVNKFGVYAGPSDVGLLKAADIGADSALNYGFFGSISQILVSSLRFFHRIFRNWGIAILVLAVIMNILLYPLTKKSYKSMQDMQSLQPKIEKLKQEHKNNSQKLQKEIMELYKKHKINPMGGCLPMLLQMPIFIALYQGLMGSIELRGAKFLWIKDLSTPENIKIPFALPLIGNSINILPILMLIAMFFQQKLSSKMASAAQTEEQKQQQKMMAIMMTVMFGFIFYSFPSGLVLYWLCNTVMMVVFQVTFTKSHVPAEHYA